MLRQNKKAGGKTLIDALGVQPNIEAERSMIGSILRSPDDIMPEVEEILQEEDFLIPEYRSLYRTCSGYFVDGKPVDIVTLAYQHEEYKVLIAEAYQSVPSIKNWREYARIVIDTAKRRRAWESAEILMESLVGDNADNCQELAVRLCEKLSSREGGNAISAKEGFAKFYSSLQKPQDYIKTGFASLDRHTYIRPGDFVVIGARPSAGKTAITLQMLLNMSKTRKAVYFSLETKNENLFGRMSANLSGIGMKEIKTQDGLDFGRLAQAGKMFDGMDFHTVEAAGWTVAQIKAKAIQLGAEIIFVDYMGLIKSEGSGRYEKITNISVDLHTLAQQSNIAVIALSQLNREGKGEPDMTHLRESGQIEQDADVILLLHAPEGLEANDGPIQERVIIIAKNKEGETGRVKLAFNGSIQRFGELETRYA